MPRKLSTAHEIQQEVFSRLHAIEEVIEDRATIVVPFPQWNEPDEHGCNWHMSMFGGDAASYIGAIQHVLAETRAEHQLKDDQ